MVHVLLTLFMSQPKHDFMSPKAIANRIKAKGLQKLRWYCQMCEKQCRDENGFKVSMVIELLFRSHNHGLVQPVM